MHQQHHTLHTLRDTITSRRPELTPILDTILDDLTQPHHSGEAIRHALEHLFERRIDLHEDPHQRHYRWSTPHDHVVHLTVDVPQPQPTTNPEPEPEPPSPPASLIHHAAPLLERHHLHLMLIDAGAGTLTAVLTPQAKPGQAQLPPSMLTGDQTDLETQLVRTLTALDRAQRD